VNPAPPPAPVSWLERNWPHVSAWIGGAAALGISFYDVEFGRRMVEMDPFILAGGLGAFGVSAAFAAGVKVPGPQ